MDVLNQTGDDPSKFVPKLNTFEEIMKKKTEHVASHFKYNGFKKRKYCYPMNV